MPSFHDELVEKSPMEGEDLEGLQLDTRFGRIKGSRADSKVPMMEDDAFNDHIKYINEKEIQTASMVDLRSPAQAHLGPSPRYPGHWIDPNSPGTLMSPGSSGTRKTDGPLPPVPGTQNICGVSRRIFWRLFGLTLAVIITGAVIGGIVGGLQAENARDPYPYSSQGSANQTNYPPISPLDVVVDSPLSVVSYDTGGTGAPQDRQSFRMYYQSVDGDVYEGVSDGWSSWQSAKPIFTDAVNFTGLASVTYLNGTQQQGSIFYVGSNGLLQEKRKVYNSSAYWLPGTLNNLNIPAVGNLTMPAGSTDPPNLFDSYRVAAVYSTKFHSGAGIRLFYHAEDLTGNIYIQELVWDQAKDTWSKGTQIQGAWPNSHLAATVDEDIKVIRILFSVGGNTVQEVGGNISASTSNYTKGVTLPSILAYNSADLGVASINGTTSLFYYSNGATTSAKGIHEIMITGVPGSSVNQETYNLNQPIVVKPGNQSVYQPLTASTTTASGLAPQILAFWADNITGNITALSGYRQLSQLTRAYSSVNWPGASPVVIPLGT